MNITPVDNTDFRARNSQIKNADKYLRLFNSQFSSASTSKLAKYNVVETNREAEDKYHDLARKFYYGVRWDFVSLREHAKPVVFYAKLVEIVRKKHKANCSEMADLMRLMLGLNGIDSYRAILEPKEVLDHVAVAVPIKKGMNLHNISKKMPLSQVKDVIIIDPWCDFVGYAPDAAINYVTTNANLVGKRMYEGWMGRFPDGIMHNKICLTIENDNKLDITKSLREQLAPSFPELIIN